MGLTFQPTVSNAIVTIICAVLVVLVLLELGRLVSDRLRMYYSRPLPPHAARQQRPPPLVYEDGGGIPEPGPGAAAMRRYPPINGGSDQYE